MSYYILEHRRSAYIKFQSLGILHFLSFQVVFQLVLCCINSGYSHFDILIKLTKTIKGITSNRAFHYDYDNNRVKPNSRKSLLPFLKRTRSSDIFFELLYKTLLLSNRASGSNTYADQNKRISSAIKPLAYGFWPLQI